MPTPPSPEELAALDAKLSKRGFRRTDAYFYPCAACQARAVMKYAASGRTGGRDISLCQACGDVTSWRSVAGLEAREQDLGFDLQAFLR